MKWFKRKPREYPKWIHKYEMDQYRRVALNCGDEYTLGTWCTDDGEHNISINLIGTEWFVYYLDGKLHDVGDKLPSFFRNFERTIAEYYEDSLAMKRELKRRFHEGIEQ